MTNYQRFEQPFPSRKFSKNSKLLFSSIKRNNPNFILNFSKHWTKIYKIIESACFFHTKQISLTSRAAGIRFTAGEQIGNGSLWIHVNPPEPVKPFALLLTHRWMLFIRNIRMVGIDRLASSCITARVCALLCHSLWQFYLSYWQKFSMSDIVKN